jgi:hypothetical protein
MRLTMKPGVDLAVRRLLAPGFGRREHRSRHVGAVSRPLTTSTSFIRVAGLKKCMPTTRCGLQPRGHRRDRQRRRVRGDDGVAAKDFLQRPEQMALGLEVLDDRLDHERAVAEGRDGRTLDARRHGLPPGPAGSRPFDDRACEVPGDAGLGALDGAGVRVGRRHAVPRLCRDLRDAGAHRAGADHADHRVRGQGPASLSGP